MYKVWGLGEGLFLTMNAQWAKNIFKEVISKDMDSKMDEEENGDERMITNNSF